MKLSCARVMAIGFFISPWSTPSLAMSPAPVPPCETLKLDVQPIAELIRKVKTPPEIDYQPYWTPYCETIALSHKGKPAAKPLMMFMRDTSPEIRFDATNALCGLKDDAAAAVPLLVGRITTEMYPTDAYYALACIGTPARSVIPLLKRQSTSDDGTNLGRAKSLLAINTLGGLGRVQSKDIVAHLVGLLDDPLRAAAAAGALGNIGLPARTALPPLQKRLSVAVAERSDDIASSIVSALAVVAPLSMSLSTIVPLLEAPGLGTPAAGALQRIGPKASAAVPFLIQRLNENNGTDWASGRERVVDVNALVAIDGASMLVRRRLLTEAVGDEKSGGTRDMSDIAAVAALEGIDPLPEEFIPALELALRRTGDTMMADSYRRLLSHTHTPTN